MAFYYLVQKPGLTRLGIMAPRRYGKAVKRNLFRRRLKEIFRHSPVTPAADIVITVYRPYEQLGFDLLQRTIRWGLEKIRRHSPSAEPRIPATESVSIVTPEEDR